MIGIGMLLVAVQTPAVQAAVAPVIGALAPRTPLAYVVVFGLLSPLALYRGPLNPYGVGIGVYTVLRDAARAAAGGPGRGRHGGGASAERLRSDQHAERVGRELHRRRGRADHAARAAVSSWGRDARRRRGRRVRTRAVRVRRRLRPRSRRAAGIPIGSPRGEQRRRRRRRRLAGGRGGRVSGRGARSSAAGSRSARCARRRSTRCTIARRRRTRASCACRSSGSERWTMSVYSCSTARAGACSSGTRKGGDVARRCARRSRPLARVDARTSRTRRQRVRTRDRVRSVGAAADLLLHAVQNERRHHARARASGRSGVDGRSAHRRHRRQSRRQVLVGVRHVSNAVAGVRRQTAHVRSHARRRSTTSASRSASRTTAKRRMFRKTVGISGRANGCGGV